MLGGHQVGHILSFYPFIPNNSTIICQEPVSESFAKSLRHAKLLGNGLNIGPIGSKVYSPNEKVPVHSVGGGFDSLAARILYPEFSGFHLKPSLRSIRDLERKLDSSVKIVTSDLYYLQEGSPMPHFAAMLSGAMISASILGKTGIITGSNANGIFLEKLETEPSKYLPDVNLDEISEDVTDIDLNQPMKNILDQLNECKIKKRVNLSGPMVVARDIAHAKLLQRLDEDGKLPDYIKDHPVYYAGPAKTPKGMPSGSFGPTTAGRMDAYVDKFQENGGSMVMLAKGNRSKQVKEACKKHGGFYLGTIGGTAAKVALDCIKKIEVLEYPELGMEAVWKIEVKNFPAFVVIDNKGNDFFDI